MLHETKVQPFTSKLGLLKFFWNICWREKIREIF